MRTGITAIHLENFKGISERVTIPLKPITLLFGANSAGKSTIMQALHYAREIIERNNPNADKTEQGGDAIDFGGFCNLVNMKETDKSVTIGFNIVPDDDGVANYGSMFKGLSAKNYQKFAKIDLSDKIEDIGIRLKIEWDQGQQLAWTSEVAYSFNSVDFCRIVVDRIGHAPYITGIDYNHPLLELPEGEKQYGYDENENEVEYDRFHEAMGELYTDDVELVDKTIDGALILEGYEDAGVVLNVEKPILFDLDSLEDEIKPYAKTFISYLNQLLIGSLKVLKQQLNEFRYLGPIREVPERHHVPSSHFDESRWADGLAAWDLLYKNGTYGQEKKKSLLQLTNYYLSENKVYVNYKLQLTDYREVPIDNILMKNFRRIAADFDGSDEDDFISTLRSLERLPIKKRLELKDTKKDIIIGANDIGIGISQMIPVIVGAVDGSKKIFAVEQPELHIHPRVQCELADVFIEEMNKGKERTFLLETHSEHFILRLLRRIRETTERSEEPETLRPEENTLDISPDDIAVLYVNSQDGETRIVNLGVDEDGEFIRDWPHGFFEERIKEVF